MRNHSDDQELQRPKSFQPSSEVTSGQSADDTPAKTKDEFDSSYESDFLQTKRELVSPNSPTVDNNPTNTFFYPASFVLLTIWVLLIVMGVCLLEESVAFATKSVLQPWYFTDLPTVFITIFTQAHGPITAVHLARLAISSLPHPHSAPRSYVEVFWLSDRAWQGPIGMVVSVFTTIKLRRRVSSTFLSFAMVSLIALVTPFILSRAYPIGTLDVQERVTVTPSTFVPGHMNPDLSLQSAVGIGAAMTGLSVLDLYNSSLYMPINASDATRANASDLFYAGDLSGLDATLPGIRLRGSCRTLPLNDDSDVPTIVDNDDKVTQDEIQSCALAHSTGNDTSSIFGSSSYAIDNANLTLHWCLNSTARPPKSAGAASHPSFGFEERVLGWMSATNASDNFYLSNSSLETAFICESTLTFGQVALNGRSRTFDPDKFQELSFCDSMQINSCPVGPLNSLFTYLDELDCSQEFNDCQGMTNVFGLIALTDPTPNSEGAGYLGLPALETLVGSLWRSATTMAAAIAILAQGDDTSYSAIQHTTTSGRTRHITFFIILLSLLGAWLVAMVSLTIRLFRPTYAPSLDSYTAGRLLVENPSLLDSSRQGAVSENPRLWARFRPSYAVADAEHTSLNSSD